MATEQLVTSTVSNAKGRGTIGTAYTAGGTSVVLTTGHGARYPAGGNYTVGLGSFGASEFELFRVSSRSSDTLTGVGAQENTPAGNHAVGSDVIMVETKETLLGLRADWLVGAPFVPPVAADYSWQDQGSATLNSANQALTIIAPYSASDAIAAQVKSLPSTPYTITACIEAGPFTYAYEGGICLTDGTKYVVWFVQPGRWGIRKYNSTSSFNSSYAFDGGTGAGRTRTWLRISDAGGGTSNAVTFYVSMNGYDWALVYTRDRNNFLTETKWGLYINPIGTASVNGFASLLSAEVT